MSPSTWTEGTQKLVFYLFTVSVSLLIAISLALSTYSIKTVVELDTRVSVIESNRFTSKDGVDLLESVQSTMDSMRSEMQTMRITLAQFPKDVPPAWWVNEVRKQFDVHAARINKIEDYIYGRD